MKPPAGFPQAHVPELARRVKAAVKALESVGKNVVSVNISPEGGITVLTGAPAPEVTMPPANTVEAILRRRAG